MKTRNLNETTIVQKQCVYCLSFICSRYVLSGYLFYFHFGIHSAVFYRFRRNSTRCWCARPGTTVCPSSTFCWTPLMTWAWTRSTRTTRPPCITPPLPVTRTWSEGSCTQAPTRARQTRWAQFGLSAITAGLGRLGKRTWLQTSAVFRIRRHFFLGRMANFIKEKQNWIIFFVARLSVKHVCQKYHVFTQVKTADSERGEYICGFYVFIRYLRTATTISGWIPKYRHVLSMNDYDRTIFYLHTDNQNVTQTRQTN